MNEIGFEYLGRNTSEYIQFNKLYYLSKVTSKNTMVSVAKISHVLK